MAVWALEMGGGVDGPEAAAAPVSVHRRLSPAGRFNGIHPPVARAPVRWAYRDGILAWCAPQPVLCLLTARAVGRGAVSPVCSNGTEPSWIPYPVNRDVTLRFSQILLVLARGPTR